MTKPNETLQKRMEELQRSIKEQRDKLQLHGMLTHDHHATQQELDRRWSELQAEIDQQMQSDHSAHGKLDVLHREILKWIDSIDLDCRA